MISSVVLNVFKMASCWFFMPPIEKQRISGMSDLLTNRLIVELEQNPKFKFSSISIEFVHFQSSNLQISSCRRKTAKFLSAISSITLYSLCSHIVEIFALCLFGFASARAFYSIIPWVIFATGEYVFG